MWRSLSFLILMAALAPAHSQTTPAQNQSPPWRSFGKPNSPQAKQAPTKLSSAEQTLFDSANRERTTRGLQPFHWNAALASAARTHALKMAQAGAISHQFPGEMDLGYRIRMTGLHFNEAAENVAQGPSAAAIHSEWMNSPAHRDNLLDRDLDSIGVAVVERNGQLFAVQDFSKLQR